MMRFLCMWWWWWVVEYGEPHNSEKTTNTILVNEVVLEITISLGETCEIVDYFWEYLFISS